MARRRPWRHGGRRPSAEAGSEGGEPSWPVSRAALPLAARCLVPGSPRGGCRCCCGTAPLPGGTRLSKGAVLRGKRRLQIRGGQRGGGGTEAGSGRACVRDQAMAELDAVRRAPGHGLWCALSCDLHAPSHAPAPPLRGLRGLSLRLGLGNKWVSLVTA